MPRTALIPIEVIELRIYILRRQKVMLDRDLAELYSVTTGRLNEQVGRNRERFPKDFMFQLDAEEFENWRSQIAISNSGLKMGVRRRPFAFTEHGILMLSSVLRSDRAIQLASGDRLPGHGERQHCLNPCFVVDDERYKPRTETNSSGDNTHGVNRTSRIAPLYQCSRVIRTPIDVRPLPGGRKSIDLDSS